MERIFKIKTKSSRDPRDQYPSERRYSASIVLGLSVVFLHLFLFSILMGTLIIHKMTVRLDEDYNITENNFSRKDELLQLEEDSKRLHDKVERDLKSGTPYYINVPALVCGGCFVMSLGYLISFTMGMLAWQRWYIDQNITFFFLATSFSTITSTICLIVALLTSMGMDVNFDNYSDMNSTFLPLTFSLAMNIMILSTVGTIWSILSSRVAFKGMRNTYPGDIVISKGGRHVEVSTIRKGSKNTSMYPPDIINHFPATDKLAKYLPKKEDKNLPKAESNLEYRQRVDQFLSGEPENGEK